jgi:hypothetical protein
MERYMLARERKSTFTAYCQIDRRRVESEAVATAKVPPAVPASPFSDSSNACDPVCESLVDRFSDFVRKPGHAG